MIIITESDTETLAGLRQTNLLADLREMAIAVIVKHERGDGLKNVGMAVGAKAFLVLAAPDVIEVPLHIAQDHQVEQAVVIKVYPRRAGGPAAASDSGCFGDVGERAVAIIAIELVAAERGHVDVLEAVIVVIADGNSHPVTGALQPCLFGDILKGAVRFLMKKAVPVCRS